MQTAFSPSTANRPATDLDRLLAQLDLVDPTDPGDDRRPRSSAPRLATLAGARIGLLENRKPNAAALLEELGMLLADRFGVARSVPLAKFIYSRPAAPEIIEELARCDAVITAIGD